MTLATQRSSDATLHPNFDSAWQGPSSLPKGLTPYFVSRQEVDLEACYNITIQSSS